MNETRLNPLNDFLFMKYMGEEGDEEQLLAFLNVVLHKTGNDGIVSVKILDTRLSADIIGEKAGIMDVRAEMDNGTKVNIEVQLREVGNMDRRSLFYWSREYVKGIQAGEDYIDLPRVITINIIDAELLSVNEVHASFHLWEDSHKEYMLTDILEIHFIDMVKFRRLKKKDIEHNLLHRWLTFFDKNTSEKTIQKIIEMDTSINKAHKKIISVAQDRDMLRLYEMHEKARYDYTSGINNATRKGIAIGEERGEQRGIAIGKQKGMQQARINYVLKASRKGISVENIAELTDLSVEEVNHILNTN
ncbi:MAG: Rpn family recombination-promoting nuclease/putative transposase [Tannerella sp.]|jgi:predicted transposase/invertase (TIGR01784 family)|nr:Rpn family recombination-promoting nuclease/putative transposase [Tannerella sp.]